MTRITSNCLAVGGMPVSNLALTTARRLPKRAAVVGTWGLPDAKRFHRFVLLGDDEMIAPGRGAGYLVVEVLCFTGRSPEAVERLLRALDGLPLDKWAGFSVNVANEVFTRTKGSGAEVIKLKGGAGFAVGVSIKEVVESVALD